MDLEQELKELVIRQIEQNDERWNRMFGTVGKTYVYDAYCDFYDERDGGRVLFTAVWEDEYGNTLANPYAVLEEGMWHPDTLVDDMTAALMLVVEEHAADGYIDHVIPDYLEI